MSGGRYNYAMDRACDELFDYIVHADYGDDGFKQGKLARSLNPCEDRELSEMVFDMFCVLHSFEWYKSSDIDEEQYRKDVRRFKEKWFKRTNKDRIEAYKGDLANFYNKLIEDFENISSETAETEM